MRLRFDGENQEDISSLHKALLACGISDIDGVSMDGEFVYVEMPNATDLSKEDTQKVSDIVKANVGKKSWDNIRRQRFPMLLEADWRIQLAEDNGSELTALRAYRQALRDITKQSNPASVVWPTKPW